MEESFKKIIPTGVKTRWGTWIECVSGIWENIDCLKEFVPQEVDSNTSKEIIRLLNLPNIEEELQVVVKIGKHILSMLFDLQKESTYLFGKVLNNGSTLFRIQIILIE